MLQTATRCPPAEPHEQTGSTGSLNACVSHALVYDVVASNRTSSGASEVRNRVYGKPPLNFYERVYMVRRRPGCVARRRGAG